MLPNFNLRKLNKHFEITKYLVDNNGNVFMLATILPDKKKGEKEIKKEQAKKFIVLGYNHKKDEVKQYEVKLSNKWVESMFYDINEKTKEIVINGFYSNDFKTSTVDGLVYMTISLKSGDANKASYKKFDKEFLTETIGKRKAEKEKGIKNYDIREVFARENGGSYFIAEEYYEVTHTNTTKNGTTTYIDYHYDNIIVASINKNAEIEWIKVIKKESHIRDDSRGTYLSFAVAFDSKNDMLNFVLNDNPKNIELLKKGKVANNIMPTKAMVTLVTINKEGNMKRVPLFSNKELKKARLDPKRNNQVSDNELILVGIQGKNYKFGKIIFK